MSSLNNLYRNKKASTLIHIALIQILKDKILDRRLNNLSITFTKVLVSNDLRIAKCYFVPFYTSTITINDLNEALESSKSMIRKVITTQIKFKYSPELRFYYDNSFANSEEVDKIIKNKIN